MLWHFTIDALMFINVWLKISIAVCFAFIFLKIKAKMRPASAVCTRARKGSAASASGRWQPPRWMPSRVGRRQGGRWDPGQQDQSGQMEAQKPRKLKLQRGRPSPNQSRRRAAPCLDAPPGAGEWGHREQQCSFSDRRCVCSHSRTHCPLGRQ